MVTPYPFPLTALEPVYIPKDASPDEAVDLLQHKVNEVTHLVQSFAQFQAPLAQCIMELQKKHETELRMAQDSMKALLVFLKQWHSRQAALQTRIEHLVRLGYKALERPGHKKPSAEPAAGQDISEEIIPSFHPDPPVSLLPPPSAASTGTVDTDSPPMSLSLKLEKLNATLSSLLDYVHDRDTAGPESSSRHGCFKGMATNCYIVRQWELDDKSKQLLRLEASIEANQMESVQTSRAIDLGLTYLEQVALAQRMSYDNATVNNSERSPTSSTSSSPSQSPKDAVDAETSGKPALIDLMQEGDSIPQDALEAPRDVYTFSLCAELRGPKSVDDLTREEAVAILRSLPLSISFCPAPAARDASGGQGTPDHDIEQRILLDKDGETGAWSLRDCRVVDDNIPSVPKEHRDNNGAPGSPSLSLMHDGADVDSPATSPDPTNGANGQNKADRKGKGRMYPSTFVPSAKAPVFPTIVPKTSSAAGAAEASQKPSTRDARTRNVHIVEPAESDRTAVRVTRATRRRVVRPVDADVPETADDIVPCADGGDATDKDTEAPKTKRRTRKPARPAIAPSESVDEPEESSPPAPVRPVRKRNKRAADADAHATAALDDAETARPKKKRKVQGR